MKKMHNRNGDKSNIPKAKNFSAPVNPSSVPWDSTPNTALEMVNTYGTYEIQPTADTDNTFPAISQGLPSKNIIKPPEKFDERIVPDNNY